MYKVTTFLLLDGGRKFSNPGVDGDVRILVSGGLAGNNSGTKDHFHLIIGVLYA